MNRIPFLVLATCLTASRTPAEILATATLTSVSPSGVVRGNTVTLTLNGARLGDATEVFFDDDAITGAIAAEAKNRNQVKVQTTIGASARLGIHRVFLRTSHGVTAPVTFAVGAWPEIVKQASNASVSTAQRVTLPCTITGSLSSPGDADSFAFAARAGEELICEVIASQIRSRLNSVLTLFDAEGRVLAENNDYDDRVDSLLGYRYERDGVYTVRIRDFENQNGGDVTYRLNIGPFPLVTSAFPLGVQRGATAELRLDGFNLPARAVRVSATSDRLTLPIPDALRAPRLVVGEAREVTIDGNGERPVDLGARPVTVNGALRHGAANMHRFRARRDETVVLEVNARRLGSPLDSVLEVLDAHGSSIPRARLRPVAETALTLSDRDSVATGLRLLSWTDFNINDYVYLGGELVQVLQLPLGPDEDVRFRNARGARQTFLETTPVAHAVNTPIYKVQVHPPERAFSPNGMPVFTLNYCNDDGGAQFGKDSRLTFTAPRDGEYLARVTDARGQFGERYAYRLTLRPRQPDFRVAMSPEHPGVPRGGSVALTFTADRLDGFTDAIRVPMRDLPPGLRASDGLIQAGETTCTVVLYADDSAKTPGAARAFQVEALAVVDGKEIRHEVIAERGLRLLTVLPPPDLTVSADRRQVAIQPGRQVTLTARIERHNEFTGRVPIEVRNLPHGVRVLDVGLNGVLITEQQTARQFVFYCEPWVKPMVWTIYVGGNVEGGLSSFAEPLTLTIGG